MKVFFSSDYRTHVQSFVPTSTSLSKTIIEANSSTSSTSIETQREVYQLIYFTVKQFLSTYDTSNNEHSVFVCSPLPYGSVFKNDYLGNDSSSDEALVELFESIRNQSVFPLGQDFVIHPLLLDEKGDDLCLVIVDLRYAVIIVLDSHADPAANEICYGRRSYGGNDSSISDVGKAHDCMVDTDGLVDYDKFSERWKSVDKLIRLQIKLYQWYRFCFNLEEIDIWVKIVTDVEGGFSGLSGSIKAVLATLQQQRATCCARKNFWKYFFDALRNFPDDIDMDKDENHNDSFELFTMDGSQFKVFEIQIRRTATTTSAAEAGQPKELELETESHHFYLGILKSPSKIKKLKKRVQFAALPAKDVYRMPIKLQLKEIKNRHRQRMMRRGENHYIRSPADLAVSGSGSN
ncbi:unnamed protein product [Ambrosiozyma monospora]|uniref:Unnamed protein product n=1 Tax=Ambrosiozyma monospora TaxID=43982 RepID=A0A9W6YSK3_AMBMO|nr:unnamed protein product [Ambrosiozyma monospora]